MKLLAIDSATRVLALALHCEGADSGIELEGDARHGGQLPQQVQALLAEAGVGPGQLDAVAVGTGPGGFAGLRVGMAFAKGLAWALDLPVVATPTLATVAHAVLVDNAQVTAVRVVMDARMSALYSAVYRRGAEALPEAVQQPQELPASTLPELLQQARAEGHALAGDAFAAYPDGCAGAATLLPRDYRYPRWRPLLAHAMARYGQGLGGTAEALQPSYVRHRVALTLAQRAAGERL